MNQICSAPGSDKTYGNGFDHAYRDKRGRFAAGNQFWRKDQHDGSDSNVGRVKRSATRRGGEDAVGDVDASLLADETLVSGRAFDSDTDVRRGESAGLAGPETFDLDTDVRRATAVISPTISPESCS